MFKKIHFPTIDSTHKWARRELDRLGNESYIITTDHQTDGIGRKGNKWFSSPNQNIICTFVFPAPPTHDLHNLAQLLAYSTIKTLKEFGVFSLFKWPNDLHLNEKKIGGVMCEILNDHVILSMGLNVNMRKHTLFPVGRPATSLYIETQKEYDLQELQERIFTTFEQDLALFSEQGFAPFFTDFASHLAYIGKSASVGEHKGVIKGLHTDGRLILNSNGKDILVSSGSLELL